MEGVIGDPILIFHPISADLYSVLLGVFRLGAMAMFLDPLAGCEHIERCCELHPHQALIASPKAHLLRLVSRALRRIPQKFVFGSWLPGAIPLNKAQALPPFPGCTPCPDEAHALLTFTSGSTGLPKAAVRTHGFLLAQHRVLERHIKLVPGEVDLVTLPVFLLANLASGVSSVVPNADLRAPGAIEPGPVLTQIARHGVTRLAASPAFFERLLDGNEADAQVLQSLREIYTGGAPVFPRLLDRLRKAAPWADIEAVHGSTEAEPVAHLDARKLQPGDRQAMRRGNGLLTGEAIPEITLRIIRDQWGTPLGSLTTSEFAALQLPPDEIGEIVVTGAHVLRGYLHGRGNEETKFSVAGQLWHRTGDAGKLDAAGRLWLLGRCAAKIEDAHGRLYPFSVECVASEHSAIRRAAFVAHGDRRVLAIELAWEFNDLARQGLAKELGWAAINEILSLEHLPVDKRHNAKVDYPTLRRVLEKQCK